MILSDILSTLFQNNIAFFIYGLALVMLGSGALTFAPKNNIRPIVALIPFLGAFAIFQGFQEWLSLWPKTSSDTAVVDGLNLLLMGASSIALFEFGRRLCQLSLKLQNLKTRYFLSPRIYALLATLIIASSYSSNLAFPSIMLWGNYITSSCGAALTAIGFLNYYHREKNSLAPLHIKRHIFALVSLFFIYTFLEAMQLSSVVLTPSLSVHPLAAMCTILSLIVLVRLLQKFNQENDEQLLAIQQQAQHYLDRSNTLLISLNRNGNITWINQTACDMLGYRSDTLLGQNWFDCYLPNDSKTLDKKNFLQLMAGAQQEPQEAFKSPIVTRDGKHPIIAWETRLLKGPNGAIYGALNSGQEDNEKSRNEQTLRLAVRVFDSLGDAIIVTDTGGHILSVNPAFEQATGYSSTEAIGKHIRIVKSGHHDQEFYVAMWQHLIKFGQWQGEIWNRRKNGEIFPEWLTISAIKNDKKEVTHYAGVFSDINTQQHVQQRLQRLAYYDTLTGLPNRAYFYDHLEQEVHRAKRDSTLFGVMFLDFDRFKNINDTLGHSVGDAVLKNIAMRLKENIRDSDTVARLGGDEFVVLLPELGEAGHAVMVAEKLMSSFHEPVSLQGRDLFVTASIGISIFPFDGEDGESLIKNADIAMYHSKAQGSNRYHFFTADMSARFRERLDLENGLRRALENNEFYLAYQPQVDIRTGRIIGIEALARWHHPKLGNVPPDRFIALAEESGMINQLGDWVLNTACRQAKKWTAISNHPFRIAINISAHQLLQHGLCETVASVLKQYSLPPHYLELELTETVLMQNADTTINTLQKLSDMGIELSIDDFGTGYSSLSYLKRFAIDKLKIDRSFVKDAPNDSSDAAIASTIIAMSRNLNLEVIAEGVETRAQIEFLKSRGCHIMQGHFFSAPTKPEGITQMLAHQNKNTKRHPTSV